MRTIGLKLKDKDIERLEELSRSQHKDKSAIVRELTRIRLGFLYVKELQRGKAFARRLSFEVLNKKAEPFLALLTPILLP